MLGFNQGLQKRSQESIGFFFGVGAAMLVLYLLFGYTGELIIHKSYLKYISLAGVCYILYLAIKIAKINVLQNNVSNDAGKLTFKDGLMIHLLNPKASLATLPIATISFPANQISGSGILCYSVLLSLLAVGAPGSYSLAGRFCSPLASNPKIISRFNTLMAGLLVYVAISIFIEHVYMVWLGVHEF
jgi:threonine/homoserine/homoserine lactone efflux protein